MLKDIGSRSRAANILYKSTSSPILYQFPSSSILQEQIYARPVQQSLQIRKFLFTFMIGIEIPFTMCMQFMEVVQGTN